MTYTRARRWLLRSVLAAAATLPIECAFARTTGPVLDIQNELLTSNLLCPTSSITQNISVNRTMRATNIDGTPRLIGPMGMRFWANPFEPGSCDTGPIHFSSLNLFTGVYAPTDVDVALPSKGPDWLIVRSYNSRQQGGHTSNGYQGLNWFQGSVPELYLGREQDKCGLFATGSGGGGASDRDVLYLVMGADRYIELVQTDKDSDLFKAKNGAAGTVYRTSEGGEDVFIYTDQSGIQMTFLGETVSTVTRPTVLWKVADAAGNTAYFGSLTASSAKSAGYESDGRPKLSFDASGRKYIYTYSGSMIGGEYRLEEIRIEKDVSSSEMIASVEYEYYTTATDGAEIGLEGDLRRVTVSTPLSDGSTLVQTKYYRYYTEDLHAVKLVMGYEGVRAYANKGSGDYLTDSDSDIKPYTDAYFTYFDDVGTDDPFQFGKIKTAFFSGKCGCSGSANGTFSFDYEAKSGFTDTTGYTVGWASRAIIDDPKGLKTVVYFDETGQSLGKVQVEGSLSSPTNFWASPITRDSYGMVTERASPASVASYTHSTGTFTFNTSSNGGLITLYTRMPYTGGGSDADLGGLPTEIRYKKSDVSGSTLVSSTVYGKRLFLPKTASSVHLAMPYIDTSSVYPTAGGSAQLTDLTYAWHSSTDTSPLFLQPKSITVAAPAVTTGNNGSNGATSTIRYIRTDGTTAFTLDQTEVVYTYSQQNMYGQVTRRIQDVKTNSGTGEIDAVDDPNTVWGITESGDGLHVRTDITYDAQGRLATVAVPALGGTRTSHKYHVRLADHRPVTISVPRVVGGGSTTYYGPVSYRVSNQAGSTVVSATSSLGSSGYTTTALSSWVDNTEDDAIDALHSAVLGSGGVNLANVRVNTYDKVGTQLLSSRAFHGTTVTESSTSNSDLTEYTYDDMGRMTASKSPAGTYTGTTYDIRGQAVSTSIGTSIAGAGNLVQVSATAFDANGWVTSQTLRPLGTTTDQRVTTYTRDFRGRVIIQQNPQSPHALFLYDNLDRTIAVGQFSSTGSLTITSDPTSTPGARLALSQTAYDERGQVFESSRSEIDQSDGSNDNTITSEFWYDAVGRQIKTTGEQLTKTQYDRLGRPTRRFVLASLDDSTYGHAADVSGDKVVEESRTFYDTIENTGLPMMQVSVRRHHNDTASTGELEGVPSDTYQANTVGAAGRISVTAMWYDALGRNTDTVAYGTYNTALRTTDFERYASSAYISVPSRPSTVDLISSTTYDEFGRVQSQTDPKGSVTRTEYDRMGRRVGEIRNYTGGSLATAARDNDVYTRFTYASGHMTEMWVDIDGDGTQDTGGAFGSNDQVTTYTYGVITGSGTLPSVIFSNDLLRSVIYPKQSSGQSASDRTVLYAYNALGEQTHTQDQNGTVHNLGYDTGGRRTVDYVSTHGTGIDTLVDKVELTYTSRGQVDTVTQFDSTTAVDQVQYTYDGWGNVKQFTQDRNGLIGAGTDDHVTVAYTYALATPSGGRVAVRRTNQTITHAGAGSAAQTLNYTYGSSSIDSLLSRVHEVEYDPGTEYPVARYEYLGLATKVGTVLPDANLVSRLHDNAGTPAYDGLDNFDRVTKSRWVSTVSSHPYYLTSPSYDAASNITQTLDGVMRGYDVKYTIDGLDRVIGAQEGYTNSSPTFIQAKNESWDSLSQTGNWLEHMKEWTSGNTIIDTTGAFSEANELTTRDYNPAGAGPTTSPSYDKSGNQTDDGEHYDYVYDAWGRLVEVWPLGTAGTPPMVARYTYNGLGYRIGWEDVDGGSSGATGGAWLWLVYNDRWQEVGTWRCEDWAYDSDNDVDPKELFIHHHAGLDGMGGSSYIDDVILRDADETAWDEPADGVTETRLYYLQNWRADVVATVSPAADAYTDAAIIDKVRYSSYGVPRRVSIADITDVGGGDFTPDGQLTVDDINEFTAWYGDPDLRADVVGSGGPPAPPDASLDLDDIIYFINAYGDDAGNIGPGTLSTTHSRRGYAGYQFDPGLELASRGGTIGGTGGDPTVNLPSRSMWHVRHRVLDSEFGRWTRRDPLGYVDGMGLSNYSLRPILTVDPSGLMVCAGISCDGNRPNDNPFSLPGQLPIPISLPAASGGNGAMCGPDITSWLANELMRFGAWALEVQRDAHGHETQTGVDWMLLIGPQLTYFPHTLFKTSRCPSSAKCKDTVTLCGMCIHTSEVGNIVYGYLASMLGLRWSVTYLGGCYGNRGHRTAADAAAVYLGYHMESDNICQYISSLPSKKKDLGSDASSECMPCKDPVNSHDNHFVFPNRTNPLWGVPFLVN